MVILSAAPVITHAQTTASGSLDLNAFSATPTSGSIAWSGAWSLRALSSVFSTDGGAAADFQTGATAASAAASVIYASAHSSASAPNFDPSALLGHVDGLVNLPSGVNQLGTVGDSGNFSSFQTSFTISGAPTEVAFGASLTSLLMASADLSGMVLRSDVIFNVLVDGAPVLSFSDLISANPGESVSSAQNPNLTGSLSLQPGVHDLYIEIDAEQQAITVPDPGSTCAMLLVSFAAVAFVRKKCGMPAAELTV